MEQKRECKPSDIEVDHHRRLTWFHEAPHGVTLEMVCDPTYWRPVAREFLRGKWPEIRIVNEDGSWHALLAVYAVGDGFAKVDVLWEKKTAARPGRKAALPEGYRTEFIKGGGWRVFDPGGDVIVANQLVESEATRIAAAHAKQAEAA